MAQIWGVVVILLSSPILGGLPLIDWIVRGATGKKLADLGTGNISVSAAFYHGGRSVGILAVLSEALKGVGVVLLARLFFPAQSSWELVALMALVVGRYSIGNGAGTTNALWGWVIHDWRVAGLVCVLSGLSFAVWRDRRRGRVEILVLFPLLLGLLHPGAYDRIAAAIALSLLLGWIYTQMPDDLDLAATSGQASSRGMLKFLQSKSAIVSLDEPLNPLQVGQKAATLSQLKRWGYPVPNGWVLHPGVDPAPLIASLHPSEENPLVVRSSALGEDTETASAAGQYKSILQVTSREALRRAIDHCRDSYHLPAAAQYRRDKGLPETAMGVLIQVQIQGVLSGVAFSRDPIERQGDAVAIEALPGAATQVVSGQMNPTAYRVIVQKETEDSRQQATDSRQETDSKPVSYPSPFTLHPSPFTLHPSDPLTPPIIQHVAQLARQLEDRFHGIPQDVEWTYDGQTVWVLQSRPITTLTPIWTRKIAAEVIPGLIRPLTWSINRPLTCGVWGEIFTLVLGDRATGLDFSETATLHYSHAYFNASLLGDIFRRMGLPAESLEFLTRGAKFSKPPLKSTLKNIPGLLRLAGRELRLEQDFHRDYHGKFAPLLAQLASQPLATLAPPALLERIDAILQGLTSATYYSILAPLSLAIRQAVLKVADGELDNGQTPEVKALRSLHPIAQSIRELGLSITPQMSNEAVFATLTSTPEAAPILAQFEQYLHDYGYLSEVGTDIAVPTWKENPQIVRDLLTQFLFDPPPKAPQMPRSRWQANTVQRRLDLKGNVTTVYSRLLAELRWSFVALEQIWLALGLLTTAGDLFFLEFAEIRQMVLGADPHWLEQLPQAIVQRQLTLEHDRQFVVPILVYGNIPPVPISNIGDRVVGQWLQGIGASPGQVTGQIKVVRTLQAATDVDRQTILVVPYTDSGWAPLLARCGGLISEVGGRLSHGAIVAREYGIPAVMDIPNATQQFQDGQQVRIDGQQGTIEILDVVV